MRQTSMTMTGTKRNNQPPRSSLKQIVKEQNIIAQGKEKMVSESLLPDMTPEEIDMNFAVIKEVLA